MVEYTYTSNQGLNWYTRSLLQVNSLKSLHVEFIEDAGQNSQKGSFSSSFSSQSVRKVSEPKQVPVSTGKLFLEFKFKQARLEPLLPVVYICHLLTKSQLQYSQLTPNFAIT
jgi:hypothetical protein